MGRPSLAVQRRKQILAAFGRCLTGLGLEGTTLDAVAAEAGVQRAAIRHFVGNRDQLVRAGVEHLAAQYTRNIEAELESESGKARLQRVLDSLFHGVFLSGHPAKDDALDVLLAAAGSDDRIRDCLREMYLAFESRLVVEISAACPEADAGQVAAVAYAILCLVEQHSTFLWLGFPADRVQAVREAAWLLMESLE